MSENIPQPCEVFKDPYSHIPKKLKSRTTINVDWDARADLSSIYPNKGSLQTTINILIEKLRNAFKQHGITTYSPDVYKFGVGNCRILLGGFDASTDNSGTATDPNQGISGKPPRKRTNKPKPNPV